MLEILLFAIFASNKYRGPQNLSRRSTFKSHWKILKFKCWSTFQSQRLATTFLSFLLKILTDSFYDSSLEATVKITSAEIALVFKPHSYFFIGIWRTRLAFLDKALYMVTPIVAVPNEFGPQVWKCTGTCTSIINRKKYNRNNTDLSVKALYMVK